MYNLFLPFLLAPFQPKQIAQGEEQKRSEEPSDDTRHLMQGAGHRQRADSSGRY